MQKPYSIFLILVFAGLGYWSKAAMLASDMFPSFANSGMIVPFLLMGLVLGPFSYWLIVAQVGALNSVLEVPKSAFLAPRFFVVTIVSLGVGSCLSVLLGTLFLDWQSVWGLLVFFPAAVASCVSARRRFAKPASSEFTVQYFPRSIWRWR